jgi:ribosomal protein S18 acetylase RimI-like enzyme
VIHSIRRATHDDLPTLSRWTLALQHYEAEHGRAMLPVVDDLPIHLERWIHDLLRTPNALLLIAEQGSASPGGCRTWGAESENRPQRGQFLPDLQAHSPAMGQEDGEKWTAAADLQPAIPKSDSLLGFALGFLQTQPNPFTPFQSHGVIQLLWVDDAWRGQGIARGLVSQLVAVFKESGAGYIEIQHIAANVPAASFWQDSGFDVCGMTRRKFL